MVSAQSVEKQLKHLKFNVQSWGRSEVKELPHILMTDEIIYECVNGMYEGGFALLVATDARVLLIDKKPLNYLTVEDLRFDMINELDYCHRLIGASITISAGSKTLKFKSYNQKRLRKLITHVQHCMAETKRQLSVGQQDQKQHLEQINQQLQAYLIAQHQQQQALREQLASVQTSARQPLPVVPKPSPELSDFLFAQSLLKQYRELDGTLPQVKAEIAGPDTKLIEAEIQNPVDAAPILASQPVESSDASPHMADLYAEGMKEIFGRETQPTLAQTAVPTPTSPLLEINPLSIAYSKLPMALRNRKFGRPSFHAHTQAQPAAQQPLPVS